MFKDPVRRKRFAVRFSSRTNQGERDLTTIARPSPSNRIWGMRRAGLYVSCHASQSFTEWCRASCVVGGALVMHTNNSHTSRQFVLSKQGAPFFKRRVFFFSLLRFLTASVIDDVVAASHTRRDFVRAIHVSGRSGLDSVCAQDTTAPSHSNSSLTLSCSTTRKSGFPKSHFLLRFRPSILPVPPCFPVCKDFCPRSHSRHGSCRLCSLEPPSCRLILPGSQGAERWILNGTEVRTLPVDAVQGRSYLVKYHPSIGYRFRTI